jgi:hypothetical protein
MKWIITISAILLFALAGCGKDKQSTNELITVDVTKNYPEKELTLQDFMDVESSRWKQMMSLLPKAK